MIWRNPVAWLGLATLLIPLAIHLLVRHRAEPRPFPSLRFVQPTRLASVKRKTLSDWPLLVIRMAILALAVAALADLLWQSAARRAEWNTRQARAIVVDTTASVADAARPLVQREAAGAFRAETFATKDTAEGIRRAASWLRTAPPARRELVVISDFQLGALDAGMFRDLPAHVGIRLVRTSGAPATRTVDGQPRTQRTTAGAGLAAAAYTLRSPRVTLNSSETAVTWVDAASSVAIDATDSTATPATRVGAANQPAGNDGPADITLRPFDVKLHGSAVDRPFLLAAAEAVLAQGVPFAAGVTGVRKSATIIVANGPANDAAPRPPNAGTLIAPWQADVVRAIATDASLSRGAGRAAVGTTITPSNTAALSSGTTSSAPSGSTTSVSPAPTAAAERPAAATASAATTTASQSATSATPSSEATARTRRASNGSSDAPEPWTVLVRDADGAPAILAAADGASGNTRMLVWSRVAAADETTALLIRATLRALAGSDTFAEAEVIAIPDATLAQWQRPAADPPASEWRDVDGNDRRWLWGAVLVLLVAEQILRRRAPHSEAQPDRKVYEHAA